MNENKYYLTVPGPEDIISLPDSVTVSSEEVSADSTSKSQSDEDEISISDIETIDSAADFKLEVCYEIFKRLKKTIGWSSPLFKLMDVILVTSVYLSIVSATFILSFHRENVPALTVFYLCDLIFVVHLLITSFVALSPASAWSTPNQLLYRKQCRKLCVIDLFTALPLEFVLFSLSQQDSRTLFGNTVAAGRLNRLLRVYRLVRFFKNKKNDVIQGIRYSDILSAACALTLLIHMSACVWYSLNCREFTSDLMPNPVCWATIAEGFFTTNVSAVINESALSYSPLESEAMHSWTLNFFQVSRSVDLDFFVSLYTICIYWSTATALSVGYGDYTALKYDETLLSIAVMLLGAAITNGLVVGTLTSLLTNVESQRATFTHRLKIIRRYLDDNRCSAQISESVRGFYEYMWFKNKGQTREDMYGTLPLSLQSEICLSVNRCALNRSPLFKNLDEGFLRSIALKIQSRFFLPGQIVINKGMVSRSMYYIVRGELEVLSGYDDSTPVAVLRSGKLFGEVNLVLNFARTASIRAATHSDLLVLDQHDVTPVLLHYPEARLAMWQYIKALFDSELATAEAPGDPTVGTPGGTLSLLPPRWVESGPVESSPALGAVLEDDERSMDLQGVTPVEEQAKKSQTQESQRNPHESREDHASRFPLIQESAESASQSTGSITWIQSSVRSVKTNGGTLEPPKHVLSTPRVEVDIANGPSASKQRKAVTIAPSTAKVFPSDVSLPDEAETSKPIPAFETPVESLSASSDHSIRHRRFSWIDGESVYKQVRRPTIQVRPPEVSELKLDDSAAVIWRNEVAGVTMLRRWCGLLREPQIRGDGTFDTAWKAIVWIVVVVQWYVYLYYASFEEGFPSSILVSTYLLDIVHVFDLVFSLMTIVISPRKTYQTYSDIFHYRIRTVSFYLDFFAALPLDLMYLPLVWSMAAVRRSRLTTVLKLNRLAKVWVIPHRFKRYEDQLYVPLGVVRPVELIVYILMGVHLSACLWFMDANFSEILYARPNSDMWLRYFYRTKNMELVHNSNLSSYTTSYVLSLYWAAATMSTTGYGDIISMTTLEYYISIVVMVLGLVLFAYSLASYASLLTNMERPKVQFQATVFAMEEFMLDNRLNKILRQRVLRYLELQWLAYDGLLMPGKPPLLHDLPEALAEHLAADGIIKILGDVPLFRDTDVNFRQVLVRKCSRYLFPPNEYVLYSGDLGRDMYVILRGYCESYLGIKQKSLGVMGPGEYFGEAGMLYGLPRPAHVVTRTHCDLLAISHSEFQRIMKSFPTVDKEIREIQENRNILHAVKLNHARIWRASKDLPRVEESLFKTEEPPSYVSFSEEKKDEYWKPFKKLGKLSFVGRLLLKRTVRPDGKLAARLEWFRIATIMVVLLMTPLHVTFFSQDLKVYTFCVALDVVTAVHMYLRLHSAYFNDDSTLVSHPLYTAQNYLASNFLLDFIACCPFDLVVMCLYAGAVREHLHTIVLFRLSRLLQVYEVVWAFSHWERRVLTRAGPFKALKHLWYFGLYVHLLACVWAYLACPAALLGNESDRLPHAEGRMQELSLYNKTQHFKLHKNCRRTSWFSSSEFTQLTSELDFYIISVLFTLEMVCSVGFGHMTPETYSEFILSIIVMVHGVIFFGYIIASVTASFVNADISRAGFNERIKKLGQQMRYEMVPKALQKKVLGHVEYEFLRSQGMQAHKLFRNLPPSIRGDVAFVLFEGLISSVPIFATIDRNFHRMLAMCLKEVFFLEGETVIFRGDIDQEMYFIHRGLCDLVDDEGKAISTLGPGRFFGEASVMFAIPRTVTIRAQTNADLFVLTKNDLQDVLENYPDIRREIERNAMVRLQEVQDQASKTSARNMSMNLLSKSGLLTKGSMMETRHGRKHKTHHRRSIGEQLRSAFMPHFLSKDKHHVDPQHSHEGEADKKRHGREGTRHGEQHAGQQDQHAEEKRSSLTTHIRQLMSKRTHDWFSAHLPGPGQHGAVAREHSAERPNQERQSQSSTLEDHSRKPPEPAAKSRPPKMTLSGFYAVARDKTRSPSGARQSRSLASAESPQPRPSPDAEKRAPEMTVGREPDGGPPDTETAAATPTAGGLARVPSIQLSPSAEAVAAPPAPPAAADESTVRPQTSRSSLSVRPSSTSPSVHEVYISGHTLPADSFVSLPWQDSEQSVAVRWKKLGSQSSLDHSMASFRWRASGRNERPQFPPPACFRESFRLFNRIMRKVCPSNFTINPKSKVLFGFNFVLTLFGALSIHLLLYQVTFADYNALLDATLWVSTLLFIVNIYVRMHTAFYDRYGDLVRDYSAVKREYMHRPTGLLVDVLSALPAGMLMLISPGNSTLRRTVTNIRFVHLARVYTAVFFFRNWERRLNAPVLILRCLRDLALLLMLLHLMACFWYLVACPRAECGENSWVQHRNLMNASNWERYVNAVYFVTASVTTTGYGDIHPYTVHEALFTILVIIVGKFALGLIISDLASTLSNLELARVEMESMLGVIVNQMKDQQVPKHLQKRVVQHVKYDWLRNRGHNLKDLLEHVPHCLRVEVFHTIYGAQLRSLTIFEHAPDFVIRQLSSLCEQQVFLPGDFITKRGDIGHKVYIVRRGSVLVYQTSPDQPEFVLYAGSIYGDVQIVYPTIPYEHNLVADDPSDVLVISQPDIKLLLADNPQFFFRVRRYVQKKYASVITDKKPSMAQSKM